MGEHSKKYLSCHHLEMEGWNPRTITEHFEDVFPIENGDFQYNYMSLYFYNDNDNHRSWLLLLSIVSTPSRFSFIGSHVSFYWPLCIFTKMPPVSSTNSTDFVSTFPAEAWRKRSFWQKLEALPTKHQKLEAINILHI